MGVNEYKLYVYGLNGVIDVTKIDTLSKTLWHLLDRLKALNTLNNLESGIFVETTNPFNSETVIKRFEVVVDFPYTKFVIKKMTGGSIDKEYFLSILEFVKDTYNERV